MMEIEDGRILIIVLNPTLTALVSKQPNEDLLPLFHIVVLVPVETPLAPVCSLISLSPSVKIVNRPLSLTTGTGLDFTHTFCILSSTSG